MIVMCVVSCGCQNSRKESDCYLHPLQLEKVNRMGNINCKYILILLKLNSGTDDLFRFTSSFNYWYH
jgi:hypothetical protein